MKKSLHNIPLKNIPDDITFCTMCFNLDESKLGEFKKQSRKREYEDFYLKSLEKIITKYKKVSIWCDQETETFIKSKGFNINTKVIELKDTPFYKYRELWIKYLNIMENKSGDSGWLLSRRKNNYLANYLIVILLKIEVLKWAKDNNVYNSKYFYWLDAGAHNDFYDNCWYDWDGCIEVKTDKFRCVFNTYHKKIYKSLISNTSIEDIALVHTPFEISGGAWVIPYNLVDKFYNKYHDAIRLLDSKNMITTEEAIFGIMLKMGGYDLFEFAKSKSYNSVYNLVSKPDKIDVIVNDRYNIIINEFILFMIKLLPNISYYFEKQLTRKLVYKANSKKRLTFIVFIIIGILMYIR